MSRFVLATLLLFCPLAPSAATQVRAKAAPANVAIVPSLTPGISLAPLPARVLPLSASLPFAAPQIRPAAAAIAPRAFTAAKEAILPALGENKSRSDEEQAAAADALFDSRRLHNDDRLSLLVGGFREAGHSLLAPQTGLPMTNEQMRSLQNTFLESRNRTALLRLAQDPSPEKKTRLLAVNKDALPREVLTGAKAGPDVQRSRILRRLSSLYRRWIGKDALEVAETVSPPNAAAEEQLGALIAQATIERFKKDPEGQRLLDQLRDEAGVLRLPTFRVLKIPNSSAFYTSHGRQLVVNLEYLRDVLLPRLTKEEAPEVVRILSNETDALEYFSRSPAHAARLVSAIEVTLFHELIHFRQDLERSMLKSVLKNEVPFVLTVDIEYEAYFRQSLYVHSLLQNRSASLDIDRLVDYLQLINDFESWKMMIDGMYLTTHLNTYATMQELENLQNDSGRKTRRLSSSQGRLSEAGARRLAIDQRGTEAIAAEKKAVEALMAEYRRLWPELARTGLERWAELNADKGRWGEVVSAQDRLSELTLNPGEAAAWKTKASQSSDRALIRLAAADGLTLNERIDWINKLAGRANKSNTPWKKELWISLLRDYPEQARELGALARGLKNGPEKKNLLKLAQDFESSAANVRATLRSHCEENLATARVEQDARQRGVVIAWGSMQASVLGDQALIDAFKALEPETAESSSTPGFLRRLLGL
ncbi:MAG: hypothetical protein AAB036_09495 [Elusimicrobiota bacterium]